MSNKLEIILRKAGRELAEMQIARLFKVPEEMQQTPVDFFGYTSYGRGILVEAKMVDRPALPIGNDPGLSVHQWNELEDANRAGCIALICWARHDICKTISMDMAIELSRGRRSIPWAAIDDDYARELKPSKAHVLLSHWLRSRVVGV